MRARTAWTFAAIAGIVAVGIVLWLGSRRSSEGDSLADTREGASGAPPVESSATSPTLQPATGRRPAPPPDGLTPADLASAPFDGIVVDENRTPIVGVTLRVTNAWGKDRSKDPAEFPTATSGADGRFRIPSPAWVEKMYVRASATGHAPASPQTPLHRSTDNRVVLLPAALVRVRVEDATTHAPVVGVRVLDLCGSDARGDLHPSMWMAPTDESVTDALGKATLVTPGGTTTILVLSKEHEPGAVEGLEVPPVGIDVTVPLAPGGTLEGRVLDSERRPVPDAVVVATGPRAFIGRTKTDSVGAFTLAHVPSDSPGRFLVATAVATGFPRATAQRIECPPRLGRRSTEIVLERWGVIHGTVRDERGRPVADARVEATEDYRQGFSEDEMLGSRSTTRTDATGAFVVREFSPQGGSLWASAGGLSGSIGILASHTGGPFEIVLRAGDVVGVARAERAVRGGSGTLGGRILRADGSPARLRVRLDAEVETGPDVVTSVGAGEVATDEGGRFRFDGLADVDYLLYPADPGLSFPDYPRTVRPGETDLHLLALTPAEEAACRVEAELVDADTGRGLGGASVTLDLKPAPGGAGETLTARLEFASVGLIRAQRALPPGRYDGVLHVHGYRDVDVSGIRVPDGGAAPRLRIRLDRLTHVEGIVLDGDGRPVPGRVAVQHLEDTASVLPDGRYAIGIAGEGLGFLVARGDYVVSAERRDRPHLAPGDEWRIDFVVKTGGAIQVSLKDGRLPERALILRLGALDPATGELLWEHAEGSTFDRKGLEASGGATLPGLAVGRYRVTPTWDDVERPARDVEVRDRETATIEVAGP